MPESWSLPLRTRSGGARSSGRWESSVPVSRPFWGPTSSNEWRSSVMSEAVIVSAVRVPTGKFLGTLKDFPAPALGAMVVREAVRRSGIDPAAVDECIMGNVVSAGVGQAPARQAALKGGLSEHVGALTINKVCGSGL